VGLLTDFGEFAVYDGRRQTDLEDAATVGLIEYFTSTDYEAKWDWLTDHLAPKAVEDGALWRLVEEEKRGRRLRPVDAAFLAEIESWRRELASCLLTNHPELAGDELNFAVQTTIDRVVFLRIAEARGLEEQNALEAIASAPSKLYDRLLELFERADTR